jgi:hypothetical protein
MDMTGQLHVPARLPPPPAKRVPCTHWIGGCDGSRTDVNAAEKMETCAAGNPTLAPKALARRITD